VERIELAWADHGLLTLMQDHTWAQNPQPPIPA
jgi:hypothetical protein